MLDGFLGGSGACEGGKARFMRGDGGGALGFLGRPTTRSNTFPGSERAKSDPRSIDTLSAPFPAISILESCVYAVEKCRCFRGPKTDVHFAGKVLDLDDGGWCPGGKAATVAG